MNKITESGNLLKDKIELISLLNRALEQLRFNSYTSISIEHLAKRAHSFIKNSRIKADANTDVRQSYAEIQMRLIASSDKLEQRLVSLFAD